ncbi:RNA polymerase factor sigma-54 [Verrucomicrobiaceae bacterium N1E253]|uniref:RNA polymerase factor sigma-54 n=1 Tax=Oceaniferula marina TaxID=2748318 RepID=A0A851GAF0_9BACT|nr:RNA polymerase factor sigma-54 [Oceaniferula marina]NWK54738.1 RNA polymerase factor sigma-54 [Oceaniferula marina]
MASSGIQHGMQQGMSQQQTLSPQMRQSLEILQANTLELSQLLHQVAEMNPTLEIQEDSEHLEEITPPDAEHDYENLSEFDDTWREEQILTHGTHQASADDEERREFLYNSIVAPLTLQQHLLDQLNRAGVGEEKQAAAEYLIGCINDRGFLDDPLETLAPLSTFTLKELRSAQSLLQGFDPAGVAVENLTESLLLQLQLLGRGGSLESRIVDQYLNKLARRKLGDIARELGVSQEAVIRAAERIALLNPDPGAAFDATSNPHVTPDLELKQDSDGHFYAQLTGDHLPKLSISNHYKDLLAKLNSDPKARKYLRDHIHEGRQIISAVSQRQETLLKIGTEIIKRQTDFLAHGRSKLRPMTMHDIAESIGVHAATISRAVAGKYILTPHGLIELRSFFTSGYTTQEGQEISNTGVREAIQQLVTNEDPAKPMSDTAVEKHLHSKGIKVARRTIAKYRDQLGILPSHLRKRHS